MLNLALTSIGNDFDCSATELGWISSVYFISSVVFLVPVARLTDIYGKQRIFKIGIILASLGMVMCALAQNVWMLCVFRAFTGIGLSCISCTSVSMISDVYSVEERGGALGINTACVYLGSSLGPSLGGVITDFMGWRYIFIVIIPLLILAYIAMTRFKYNIASDTGKPYDMSGAVTYGIGMAMVMTGLILLPETLGIILMVLGGLIFLFFIRVELKEKYPVMEMKLFKNSRFSRSLIALFLNYAASYCVTFFLSLYLQNIGAMTSTQAGILLMVQPICQVILTPIMGKLSDRIDKRILPTVGMVIITIGLFVLSSVTMTLDLTLMIISMILMGVGYGIFSAPNTSAAMSYVKPNEYNKASGLIATLRQCGMMLSMGLATCLISVFMGSTSALSPENYDLFLTAMKTAIMICVGFCAIGAVVSWFRGKPLPSDLE